MNSEIVECSHDRFVLRLPRSSYNYCSIYETSVKARDLAVTGHNKGNNEDHVCSCDALSSWVVYKSPTI